MRLCVCVLCENAGTMAIGHVRAQMYVCCIAFVAWTVLDVVIDVLMHVAVGIDERWFKSCVGPVVGFDIGRRRIRCRLCCSGHMIRTSASEQESVLGLELA